MNIIFSDGSLQKVKNRKIESICGSGTIVRSLTNKKEFEKMIPLPDSTNNYAELNGIYEGLLIIKKQGLLKKEPVIIVTDSKYCITVLTDTMILEGKKGLDAVWKNKDKSNMKNPKIIKKIYQLIIDKDGDMYDNIKFVHVNSHLKANSKEDLDRIIHKFKQVGITINEDGARGVIELNARADKLAKEAANSLLVNY